MAIYIIVENAKIRKLNKLSSKQLLRNQKYPKKIIDTDFEKLSKIPIEILRAEKKRIKNLQLILPLISF